MSFLAVLNYYYSDLWRPVDSRLSSWPSLTNGPWSIVTATVIYVYVATRAGPQFMAQRKPMDIKGLMLAYNLLMVLINLVIFIRVTMVTSFGLDTWGCRPFGRFSPNDLTIVGECFLLGWYYHVSKYIDWLDTLFFIGRKKGDHLTTLHIAHHALMPFFSWFGLVKVANMAIGFIPWVNSFVHCLMYSYYALSIVSRGTRFLPLKRWLTGLQMLQLAAIVVHSTHFLFIKNCDIYGNSFIFMVVFFSVANFYLFALFFRKRYLIGACMNRK
ncbi:Elongation of very long chain fatty acids protein 7 [Halotydeus destructor]|nr:Elongation of very long chain fatty acids protein 7 [Halotydeus destructor]